MKEHRPKAAPRRKIRPSALAAAALCALALTFMPAPARAADIAIYVDGKAVTLPVPPLVTPGRVLIPLRTVSEALGAYVQYTPSTKGILIQKDGRSATLTLNRKEAVVNGEAITLDVAATASGTTTMVPLRFAVEQALLGTANYNSAASRIDIISYKGIPEVPLQTQMAAELLEIINTARQTQGLMPLVSIKPLTNMAERHARDMAAGKFFSHDSPSYGGPAKRASELGISPSYTQFGGSAAAIGENIARGYPDAQSVFDAWLTSKEHLENIMNPDLRFIGIGIAQAAGADPDEIYFCLNTAVGGLLEMNRSAAYTGNAVQLKGYAASADIPLTVYRLDPANETRYLSREAFTAAPGADYSFSLPVSLTEKGIYLIYFGLDILRIDNR